jgi:cytochrome c556
VKKRLAMMLGMVAVLGLGLLGGSAEGRQDEAASIKKVMGKLHGKGKGLLPAVSKALQSDSPNWAEVKKGSKLIVDLSRTIVDVEPPKGDKENYNKLSKAYLASATDLHEAAEAEDAAKAKAAAKKLGGTCKTCHSAHKGQ